MAGRLLLWQSTMVEQATRMAPGGGWGMSSAVLVDRVAILVVLALVFLSPLLYDLGAAFGR